jgi:TolB-like protein/DNA-binding winged helix-turn-helix (wHTH) protein/Tfp pilus assembly protein PilF
MRELGGAPAVLRFGAFEVDLGARELRKKGAKIRLQEQPLRVLAVLLERPGQVVTRDELKQRLWAGTVVDFDHGLNTTINRLREALGDDADTPRFIETVPRFGYRFICPVNGAPGDRGTGAPAYPVTGAPPIGAVRARWWRRRWALTLVLVVLPTLALALLALDVRAVRERLIGRPGASISSIAVLPLKNLSGDAQQDHFAEGMTEALITELGKIGSLQVLSYPSVLAYRQTAKPLPQIAREVNVDAFLVGAVLHSGGRVRVTASLFQASPERRLWTESYESDVRDVLAVQKDLARDVAARIGVRIAPREQVRLAVARRIDAEAYEAYLLGRAHLHKAPTAASYARARAYFETAIARDPGYAPAYVGLADVEMRAMGTPTRTAAQIRVKARQWIEKALELDDTVAEAHSTLARIAQQEWDWAGAEREYRRAIELNASYARARIGYTLFLLAMARFDEAAAQARRAQALDPASPFVNTWAGSAYWFAGRSDEATASWNKALELDPAFSNATLVIARAHVTEGNYPQAIAELRKGLSFDERQPFLLGALVHAHARAGQRAEALKVLGELRRIEAEERGYVPLFGAIWAYAGLGDRDAAFAALEKACEQRVDRIAWLNVDPLLEPLRSDPRFEELVRRVGLPTRGSPPRSAPTRRD